MDEWLAAQGHALRSLNPDETDSTDLLWLGELVEGRRVVAIGESMHRIHEFYAIRDRLIRYLVREHGFTAVAMESGLPESTIVADYLRGDRSDIRTVLSTGITYHMGKCQEMLDQLAWMREYTRSGGRIEFYGIDIPDSSASARPAIEGCLPFLDRADPGYAAVVRDHLLPLFDYLPTDRSGLVWAAPAIFAYLALDDDSRHAITAGIGALTERLAARRVANAGLEGAAFALRSAKTARHADAFLAAMVGAGGRGFAPANIRDLAMAANTEALLSSHERIVVIAANGHIQTAPFSAPPFVTEPMTTMGEHLRARIGMEYLAIATSFGGGDAWLHRPAPDSEPGHSIPFTAPLPPPHPDTLDALLSRRGGSFGIDLRTAPAGVLDGVDSTMNGTERQLVRPLEGFEAAIHVESLTPWHTWIDERGISA